MAKLLSILFLSLVPAHATVLNRPWLADMGLNAWPMLQAHDAATGYLEADGLIENILYRFTKTQYGNASSQLDCGIRAFDWRPNLQNETLGFAHGAVFINHSMLAAAEEVVAWANAHASEAEDGLVLLIVADCNGQACWDAATAAFSNAGLPVLAGDSGCATASGFTLSAAMAAAALPGGGHALALMNCPSAPVQTYDDRCSCTGFFNITEGYEYEADVSNCLSLTNPQELQDCLLVIAGTLDESAHFACYNGHEGRNSSYPFDRLLEFNSGVAAVPLPSAPGQQGLLASLQGCWAQNVQSTILSFFHNSSLLLDESRVSFNKGALLSWIEDRGNATRPPLLQNLNLVGINAACDGGPELLAALRARIPNKDD